jgi:hypothetical protein
VPSTRRKGVPRAADEEPRVPASEIQHAPALPARLPVGRDCRQDDLLEQGLEVRLEHRAEKGREDPALGKETFAGNVARSQALGEPEAEVAEEHHVDECPAGVLRRTGNEGGPARAG